MKQRLRPHRSVSLPPGIIRAAMTSRKIVIAVCTPWTVVSRSSLMSLIITFMFEPAKLQMNWASASGTSSFRGETVDLARFRFSVMWLPPIQVQPRSRGPTSTLIAATSVARALNAAGASPPASLDSEHWPLP